MVQFQWLMVHKYTNRFVSHNTQTNKSQIKQLTYTCYHLRFFFFFFLTIIIIIIILLLTVACCCCLSFWFFFLSFLVNIFYIVLYNIYFSSVLFLFLFECNVKQKNKKKSKPEAASKQAGRQAFSYITKNNVCEMQCYTLKIRMPHSH